MATRCTCWRRSPAGSGAATLEHCVVVSCDVRARAPCSRATTCENASANAVGLPQRPGRGHEGTEQTSDGGCAAYPRPTPCFEHPNNRQYCTACPRFVRRICADCDAHVRSSVDD